MIEAAGWISVQYHAEQRLDGEHLMLCPELSTNAACSNYSLSASLDGTSIACRMVGNTCPTSSQRSFEISLHLPRHVETRQRYTGSGEYCDGVSIAGTRLTNPHLFFICSAHGKPCSSLDTNISLIRRLSKAVINCVYSGCSR